MSNRPFLHVRIVPFLFSFSFSFLVFVFAVVTVYKNVNIINEKTTRNRKLSVDTTTKQTEGNDLYSQCTPDLDEYTKEPPPLPPHLRQIILNKNPPANDPSALAVPRHVVSGVGPPAGGSLQSERECRLPFLSLVTTRLHHVVSFSFLSCD